MKKIVKKVIALALVAAMAMTVLVGCAETSIDDSAVVATVGDKEITAGLLNFYVRFQQSSVESTYSLYYGDKVWSQEVSEGVTMAENIVNSSVELLEQLYVLEAHMGDYKVELTEEDKAAIDKAAEDFIAANKSSNLEKISATKENVARLLTLFAISNKMYDAVIVDADTDVKEEEYAMKKMSYYFFDKTKTVDGELVDLEGDELNQVLVRAKAFLAGAMKDGSLIDYAKENEEVEAKTLAFNADSKDIAEEVIAAADKLKKGEFTEVIDTEYYYFVAQLESEFDQEATDKAKEDLITERESEHYSKIVEEWIEKAEIKEVKSAIKKIDVASLKITEPAKDSEE